MRAARKRRGPAALPLRVLLANPRGFCAGVDRAVTTVERALEAWGPPVYVRRHVVHNRRVVEDLEARGAIFVESELDVPANSRLVLAAHGVPPEVYANAAERNLLTIDTTCPLVRKVHAEVRSFAARGCTVVVVGHAGHDEVVGTAGQAPDAVVVVGTPEQASAVELREGSELAFVTQTTLSVDDTADILAILRTRYPQIVGPRTADICYATTNRQMAVKRLLELVDVVVVAGSRESSNSNRLVETARAGGVPAWLVENERALDERMFRGCDAVGVTSGASTPEDSVMGICDWFRERGVSDISEVTAEQDEDVVFRLPSQVLRREAFPPRLDDAGVSTPAA